MDEPTQPPSMAPQGEDALHGDRMVINMGPSHPSTHGVLRLVLTLDGEVVRSVQPHLGYLHRGMEKIAETMTYHQFIPYTDRLDYLAPLSNNVAYILAVEKLMGITAPPRAQVIRVLCCEIARISAHLLWLGTGALDLGAATVFFHTFRERLGETPKHDNCADQLVTFADRRAGVLHGKTRAVFTPKQFVVDGVYVPVLERGVDRALFARIAGSVRPRMVQHGMHQLTHELHGRTAEHLLSRRVDESRHSVGI